MLRIIARRPRRIHRTLWPRKRLFPHLRRALSIWWLARARYRPAERQTLLRFLDVILALFITLWLWCQMAMGALLRHIRR